MSFESIPLRTSPPRFERRPTDECAVCGEALPFATRTQVGPDEWACGYPCDSRWAARHAADPRDRLAAAADLPIGEDEVEVLVRSAGLVRGFVAGTRWEAQACGRHRIVVIEDGDGCERPVALADVLDVRLLVAA